MIEIKRILHPTDFSDSSAAAAKYASLLAEQFGAEFHLLFVIEDALGKIPDLDVGFPPPGEVREETMGQPTPGMQSALGVQWHSTLRVVLATRLGAPPNEIIDYARLHDVDMIVQGTHGRTGVARAFMGSVSEAVVRHAPCPVVTIQGRKRPQRAVGDAVEEDATDATDADAEFSGWIRPDRTRGLHVGDLVGPNFPHPMAVCRAETGLLEIVGILRKNPGTQTVYVIDADKRLQGQVTFSVLSETLLLDYPPSNGSSQPSPEMKTRYAEDVMEPVDVAVREAEMVEEVLSRIVPIRKEEFPVVDDEGRLIRCLRVVDILWRVVASDE